MMSEKSNAVRLMGLPPVVSSDMAVLVLGSFPGVASLRAQQYYGHPQNHFWRILQALWPQHPLPAGPGRYAERCQWLLDRRLGVWDVYASCLREGSLDTAIRGAVVNDFARLRASCPRLTAIAHNGAESYKHAPRCCAVCRRWRGPRPVRPSNPLSCRPPARQMPPGVLIVNCLPGPT